MSNLGEDIVAMAQTEALASANEEGLVGFAAQLHIQYFVRGFLKVFIGARIKLLHHFMKNDDKTYDEAALYLALTPAEIEAYPPLLQAYISDQELYQTLLDKTIIRLMRREAVEEQATEI